MVSLQALLSGELGLQNVQRIRVYSAHNDAVCTLDIDTCVLLLGSSAEQWQPMPIESEMRARAMVLVNHGLLLLEGDVASSQAQADQQVRSGNWWPLSAIYHRHSRWDSVDSVGEMEQRGMTTAQALVSRFGRPPPEAPPRHADSIALPRSSEGAGDDSLARRVTCRNYDPGKSVAFSDMAAILQDVLMAQATVESEPGVRFLKKNVPSGGGLHPLEAYIVAQNVEGLPPGVYHYHSVAHELARIADQPRSLDEFSLQLLAGQHWFAGAQVIIALVCRFQRSFWKYRRHTKAYRAVTLDAGHVSQALYVAATKRGLGAFVTAAINEKELERLLLLDPMVDGAIAVCGFGWRSEVMREEELDPAGRIWQRVSAV